MSRVNGSLVNTHFSFASVLILTWVIYMALLRIYKAILRIYRALLRICRAFLRVSRASAMKTYLRSCHTHCALHLTRCNILQHTATLCNTQRRTCGMSCTSISHTRIVAFHILHHTATHCLTVRHTTPHLPHVPQFISRICLILSSEIPHLRLRCHSDLWPRFEIVEVYSRVF